MIAETDRLMQGDFVDITVDGRTVPGMVTMASSNGESLVVMFEAILDRHVGQMPVLYKGDGFIAVMTGTPVILKRRADDEEAT